MRKYDVLLQAGHIDPREPGFESGTGARGEQEWTELITGLVAKRFRSDGRFNVTTCPGRMPRPEFEGDIFISNHADGSVDPKSAGMSFGYQNGAGATLARLIRKHYDEAGHPGPDRRDNYTNALSGYYGFSRVDCSAEVLVESGFVTNPGERAWMFANADKLATAQYEAVLDYLGLVAGPIRQWNIDRRLTKEQVRHRNNLTIRRTDPNGAVTVWRGWRSDKTGANNVLRVLATSPESLNFKSKFEIAWQGQWFRSDELGVRNFVNVAKSIWSRFS